MYRQKINLLNSSISSTRSHNMVNFGPLVAEISLPVWRIPANFNGFWVLASLLHQRRSTEVNQTLHNVSTSPGLVHYVYIFGGSCPIAEILSGAKFTLRPSLAFSPILAALLHGTRVMGAAKLSGVQQRAPPVFVRVAIMLGIGPHSS